MKINYLKSLNLILFISGILLVFNSQIKITGRVIGISDMSLTPTVIIGFALVFSSLALSIAKKGLEKKLKRDYYKNRVKEIFNPDYNGQDVWVSRWELDGIMDYLQKGNYDYLGIEHGKGISIHPYGKHKIPHLNIKLKKDYETIKRHLLITEDPYDPRLKNIGINQDGKRIETRVYDPNHPRADKKTLRNSIRWTIERE